MREPDDSTPTTSQQRADESVARPSAGHALDPAVFELLLARIEQLSRELGRAEGRQATLERQVARLEQQLAQLERERGG